MAFVCSSVNSLSTQIPHTPHCKKEGSVACIELGVICIYIYIIIIYIYMYIYIIFKPPRKKGQESVDFFFAMFTPIKVDKTMVFLLDLF